MTHKPDTDGETDVLVDSGSEQSDEMSPAATQVTSQSGNDERGTPVTFIRKLQDSIGGLFDLDPCSGAEPQPIAHTRFTKEDNGLAQSWIGYENVYVNPPYSELLNWLRKIDREATRDDPDAPELIMCLLPGNTSTQWFHQYATNAEYLCLIEGRLQFNGTDKNAPFASILVVYGNADEDVLETLDKIGATYTREEFDDADQYRQGRLEDMVSTDGGGVVPDVKPTTIGNSPTDTTETTENALPTPRIMDVSRDAPAVPQGVIDFYDIAIGDEFYIELDTTRLGFPPDVPEEGNVKVLAGDPAGKRVSQTPEEWRTLTCYHEETDTWFVLCQDPNDISDIRCSVSLDGQPWIDVDIARLHRLSSHSLAAIEPYGEGTSYVC